MDCVAGRVPVSDFGVCKVGDGTGGGAVPDGTADGVGPLERPGKAVRARRTADAASDETAGSRNVDDLFADFGDGCVSDGLRWQYAAAIGVLAIVLIPSSWFLLKDYQKSRIQTFLDPSRDPKGDGYQVIQSKIAIGNGGMWGKGVTKGTQTRYQFLPVPHTDFVFSAFAEELNHARAAQSHVIVRCT